MGEQPLLCQTVTTSTYQRFLISQILIPTVVSCIVLYACMAIHQFELIEGVMFRTLSRPGTSGGFVFKLHLVHLVICQVITFAAIFILSAQINSAKHLLAVSQGTELRLVFVVLFKNPPENKCAFSSLKIALFFSISCRFCALFYRFSLQ